MSGVGVGMAVVWCGWGVERQVASVFDGGSVTDRLQMRVGDSCEGDSGCILPIDPL